MSQIIPYLILLSQHLNYFSIDISWIASVNNQLLELLQLQERSDKDSEELKRLENTLLKKLIIKLIQLLTGQCLFFPQKREKDSTPSYRPYHGFTVDSPPIIENYHYFKQLKQLDYQQLLTQHQLDKGRPLKPISPNKIRRLNYEGNCPICGAPHNYLYENNIEREQMLCKVCKQTFTIHKTRLNELKIVCPHCSKSLERIKDRNDFSIFKCKNNRCEFYLKNKSTLEAMSDEEKAHIKQNPQAFKLRFIYRAFDLKLPQLNKEVQQKLNSPIDLAKIRNSKHVLGLVLTYYVNYGLSSRKTPAIMHDVHQISISHQTVVNYAQAAAVMAQNYVENYPYELTEELTGDETYVKVKKKNHYVFFISDKVKKIITSYQVFEKRDTLAAIKSVYQTLLKYPEKPENLRLVLDGNPIYQLAQLYFSLNKIPFELIQVIGLQNKTETDRLFRPYKQVTERLNRTFKQEAYLTMNGFNSLNTANGYLVLFTAYFNFLRRHESLNWRVPIEVPEIEDCPHMPAKWVKLIELSYEGLCA